ncbi:SusC/RagA family TonB-linked outer membrane protein [Aliifodinibius sp. S!AR15-10]|uniref:SusC/RagA family TonB-linked outer membrane protein n=1 Tax=Aliifodinibius sp. S!AR15-10 TaxID=2950437 RepID=UPI00286719E3|nr:SusC/RagA family TonB-linked outer membrane protein [Aliifodinibius sp. S!AR15-10]MDR8390189.1 SusC/RagA family TonB-linked outer membrane protein [Aliifodinibius sp. S!AR15-10]
MISFRMHHLKYVFLIVGICLLSRVGQAQTLGSLYTPSEKNTLSIEQGTELSNALKLLEQRFNVVFLYRTDAMQGHKVSARQELPKNNIEEALTMLLEGQGLKFKYLNPKTYGIFREQNQAPQKEKITIEQVSGQVTDASSDEPLPGVNIAVKGTTTGTSTNADGSYQINAPSLQDTLVFSFIGFQTQEVPINGRTQLNIALQPQTIAGEELVVVGYGTQEKGSITGSISSVGSEELGKVKGGATVSTTLAGKVSGLSFRQAEGRPGSSANIEIRNMGTPLYVIDGIVKDEGQFNNLSSSDIESISVLKDASASAIYGSRAANGVVVVETKRGSLNSAPTVGVDTYYGFQRMTRFPNDVLDSGFEYNRARARAEINSYGNTSITQEELDKWQAGTEYGYQSYDWADIIYRDYAPKYQANVNVSGGSENTNYYFSVTRFDQDAVCKQYNFNRTNLQANVDTRVGAGLQVGFDINGRVESRRRPGIPGFDDYWLPRFSVMRNRPTYGPYANDNPNYLNDIGHTQTNAGLWNYETSGKWSNDWRAVQANVHADYDFPIEGLEGRVNYSYYYATNLLNNHEFTYDAYTYDPSTDTYNRTGGSTNPWQERGQDLITEDNVQVQLNYNNSFGDHNVAATAVSEWFQRDESLTWEHNVPPVNELDIIQYEDMDTYDHSINEEARIGYVGRLNYNYDNKYYLEFAGRYDASWKWPPNKRWGFFPSGSVGWRITEEPFFQDLVGEDILTNLKFRASYGVLGDDEVAIGNYAYVAGYNYATGTFINDGSAVTTSADRGLPITNITWFTSEMTDIGADFEFLGGTIEGSLDYFYRKRDGLLAARNDVLLPAELGYGIPPENLESDAQMGGELALTYNGNSGEVNYSIFGNVNYSRHKTLERYRPRYGNSWDKYRSASENRWSGIFWGYQVTGQFQSQEQINNYDVNIDGEGNTTLLPGDFIYKDVNGDGVINGYDERPIGYNTGQPPSLYGGFGFSANWKGFDLTANFSFGGMYSYNRNWEARWPFQNNGNLLKSFQDAWHRADVFDPNSEWISGKYPALRYNQPGHSNYNKNSTYWLINIRYLRLRTLQLGYNLPTEWANKLAMKRARVYVNTYNLFSIDNLKNKASFLDPEVADENGLQYPQMKTLNIGVNLTF